MIFIKNDCCDCGCGAYPCIDCGLRHNPHYNCDKCGKEADKDDLIEYDGGEYCRDCLFAMGLLLDREE